MKVKEESEKVGLKLNIQKTKIMASGPITSCQIDGETVETVSDFILGGSKITADGGCSHEIKRCLLLGRKVMTNLDSILKSRDITLPTKVHLVSAMVFPVVMYRCESWTRDGGAWWAAVCGVAQSQTGLKQLSSSSSRMFKESTVPKIHLNLFLRKFKFFLGDPQPEKHGGSQGQVLLRDDHIQGWARQ